MGILDLKRGFGEILKMYQLQSEYLLTIVWQFMKTAIII